MNPQSEGIITMTKNSGITKLLTKNNEALLSTSFLLLRCVAGIVLFMVGAGKVFGWFGGYGMAATIKGYSQMGFSMPLAYLSSYTELIGGLLFIIGFLTRPVAIAVIINMVVATIVMLPHGFLGPSGSSYPFAFLIISISILISGPMSFSIDSLIFQKQKQDFGK